MGPGQAPDADGQGYRPLIEYLPEVIYTAEAGIGGRWLYVSPQSKTVLGYTHDDFSRDPMLFYQQVAPEDRTRLIEEEERSLSSGSPLICEFRFHKSDGSLVWLRMKSALLKDPETGRRFFQGFLSDITESKRTEERRELLEAQLQQAQKMEAVGRLAGGIAHDFNNILSVIINYADFLRDELASDDARRADVEEIRLAGQRGAKLVRQLLAFSRSDVIEPEVLDVSEIVASIKEMLRRLIGEDIELTFTRARTPAWAEVDQTGIEQLMLNLAANARDAMPEGGALRIATSVVTVTQSLAATTPGLERGRYVCVTVSDTGSGMSDDVAKRAFEPFFTTKATGEGTGLGLATAYGMVRQLGGCVVLHTKPDEGTTFEIFLPFVPQETNADASPEEPDHGGTQAATVLVVEDEAPVRQLVQRILQRAGYSVVAVGTAAAALHVCRTRLDEIDVLLTDVVMPEMSGKALADRIARAKPELKVLFMSGYTDDVVSSRGVGQDGPDFIHKPFSAGDVLDRVRAAVGAARI